MNVLNHPSEEKLQGPLYGRHSPESYELAESEVLQLLNINLGEDETSSSLSPFLPSTSLSSQLREDVISSLRLSTPPSLPLLPCVFCGSSGADLRFTQCGHAVHRGCLRADTVKRLKETSRDGKQLLSPVCPACLAQRLTEERDRISEEQTLNGFTPLPSVEYDLPREDYGNIYMGAGEYTSPLPGVYGSFPPSSLPLAPPSSPALPLAPPSPSPAGMSLSLPVTQSMPTDCFRLDFPLPPSGTIDPPVGELIPFTGDEDRGETGTLEGDIEKPILSLDDTEMQDLPEPAGTFSTMFGFFPNDLYEGDEGSSSSSLLGGREMELADLSEDSEEPQEYLTILPPPGEGKLGVDTLTGNKMFHFLPRDLSGAITPQSPRSPAQVTLSSPSHSSLPVWPTSPSSHGPLYVLTGADDIHSDHIRSVKIAPKGENLIGPFSSLPTSPLMHRRKETGRDRDSRSSRRKLSWSGDYDTGLLPSAISRATSIDSVEGYATGTMVCKCSGGCRNARCCCVKAGEMCSQSCKCKICRNPFSKLFAAGVDVIAARFLRDNPCFLHNLSRIKDMTRYIHDKVTLPCCGQRVLVKESIPSLKCEKCGEAFSFSWCDMELYNDSLNARWHCSSCKKCHLGGESQRGALACTKYEQREGRPRSYSYPATDLFYG